MDMPTLSVDGLEAIATRLDRCAEHVATQADRTRSATSDRWRGPAAERHQELVTGHARDLDELARALREAARRVCHLGATARARVTALGEVDLTVGIRR
ncbi:MAG TPA: hypothetical protein H9805_12365 [Candidatus Janibacter merdipullorum]|nr:hypothetical protein [Candidatus Janibacter merdipullorum]